MFRNVKLGVMIGAGFSLLILMAAVIGYVGWSGSNRVLGNMEEYVFWGEVDMVMNEDVSQNVLKLQNAAFLYKDDATSASLDALQKQLAATEEGVGKWKGIVKEYPELVKSATSSQEQISVFRASVGEYSDLLGKKAKLQKEWLELTPSLLHFLNKTMKDVIDPARASAEKAGKMDEALGWSSIDMTLNENVVARVLALQMAELGYMAKSGEKEWASLQAVLKEMSDGVELWRKDSTGHGQLGATTEALSEYLASYARTSQSHWQVMKQMKEIDQQLERTIQTLLSGLEETMAKVIDPRKQAVAEGALEAQRDTSRLTVVFSLACVIMGMIVAFTLTRRITRPIGRIIEGLTSGSGRVAAASNQIASASCRLAEGASQQAAAIEETSASLEEMSSMTRQNAESASRANELMREAGGIVDQANRSMADLIGSMAEITRGSEESFKIIRTIDDIAFQTNLLALNAAVEAARAGEAGAGFAVVADEVRNLAMRAADAAKNTAGLIESTVRNVRLGSEVVNRTEKDFLDVASSVSKCVGLIGDIAAASQEQAMGIEQVNKAVSEMDQVTQQNASNAEESAASSEEMRCQAEEMGTFVEELILLVDGGAGSKTQDGAPREESHASFTFSEQRVLKRPTRVVVDSFRPSARNNGFKEDGDLPPRRLIPFDDLN
ncbi:MAG: methyl-accepting chemotaxis protein [Acidobacteriota bacterium]